MLIKFGRASVVIHYLPASSPRLMLTSDGDVNKQLQPNLPQIMIDVRLSNHSSETATTNKKVADNIVNENPIM